MKLNTKVIKISDLQMIDEKLLYRELGKNIKELRLQNNLNQSELANLLGFNRTSVINIEAGTQRITLYALYRLCSEFKISVLSILPCKQTFIEYSVETNTGNIKVGPKTYEALNRVLLNLRT